jgi:hypothetical protein
MEVTMTTGADNRTLGEMFSELSRETRTLIQQEMELARVEVGQIVSKVSRSAVFIVGGGLLAYGGLLAIIAGVILGLVRMGLAPWAAALAGGVAIALLGYLLIRSGLAAFRQQDLKPTHTIDTLKEDAQWLKSQAR